MDLDQPNAVDVIAALWFGVLALGLPLAGWVMMGLDYRAYLRSLRRAIAVVKQYQLALPEWARRDRPPCLQELGLAPNCSRDEVLTAYRKRVKQVHPDLGGTERDFQRLQRHLTEALSIVEAREQSAGNPQGAA